MREIKYRAWDKVNNKMQYSGIIWGDYNFPILSGLNYGNDINNLSNLMQYTGLKDKNGTEIYEGDIIAEWVAPYMENKKDIHIVKWDSDDTGFYPFTAPAFGGYEWNNCQKDEFIEVIGNIYESKHLLENPELLDIRD